MFDTLRADEKTAIFIDGANLYKAARNLGFDMDYKSLLAKSKAATKLVRASYYTSIQEDKSQDYSPPPAVGRLARLQRLHNGDQNHA